jgi:hypothetical protein
MYQESLSHPFQRWLVVMMVSLSKFKGHIQGHISDDRTSFYCLLGKEYIVEMTFINTLNCLLFGSSAILCLLVFFFLLF